MKLMRDVKRITKEEVPIASFGSIERCIMRGTIRKPPPIEVVKEIKPTKIPERNPKNKRSFSFFSLIFPKSSGMKRDFNPIKRIEKLEGGWGIILDDLMAGVYTILSLTIILRIL